MNEFTRWKALRAEGTGGLRGQDRTWQDRTGQDRAARPCCPDAALFDYPALFDCPAHSAFQRVSSFTRPNPPGGPVAETHCVTSVRMIDRTGMNARDHFFLVLYLVSPRPIVLVDETLA